MDMGTRFIVRDNHSMWYAKTGTIVRGMDNGDYVTILDGVTNAVILAGSQMLIFSKE